MRTIMVNDTGGPEVLSLEEVSTPEPQSGQVRVRVCAAGVNYADIMQREGLYPNGPKPPYGAGFEVAGTVDAVGEGVTQWASGERVMGFCSGGYSDFVIAPAAALMPCPDGLDFELCAAIPCQYLTAYHTLFTLGNLQQGQTVLIQAAAGGLGSVLVQLVKLAGAKVIGTCGSAEKVEFLRSIECDHIINYNEDDFAEVVKEITGGAGCDLVVESVGGDVFEKSMRCVKRRGHIVTLGVASKNPGVVNPVELLARNITLSGFHLNDYMVDAEAQQMALRKLYEWVGSGELQFHVRHVYPLEEAAQAHRDISDRRTLGKVILQVA